MLELRLALVLPLVLVQRLMSRGRLLRSRERYGVWSTHLRCWLQQYQTMFGVLRHWSTFEHRVDASRSPMFKDSARAPKQKGAQV